MPSEEFPLHGEVVAVLRKHWKTELLDRFDADFGIGGVFFIANGTPYEVRFDLEEAPDEFVLRAGAENPFMEVSREMLKAFLAAMQKAYPEVQYGFGNVCGQGMEVSVTGRVPSSPDRALAVESEFLRCKQLIDDCIAGQHRVIGEL